MWADVGQSLQLIAHQRPQGDWFWLAHSSVYAPKYHVIFRALLLWVVPLRLFLWTLSYLTYITHLCSLSPALSLNFSPLSIISFLFLPLTLSLTSITSPILPLSFLVSSDKRSCTTPRQKWELAEMEWVRKKKQKQKRERSAGGSTRGLRCQLDTTQTERGRARDIDGQRRSGRERERKWEEVNEREERKVKKNDWGNITGLQEKGKRRERKRSGGG